MCRDGRRIGELARPGPLRRGRGRRRAGASPGCMATAEPIKAASRREGAHSTTAQQAAVAAALEHGVIVLTGGPGTGKSRTVATLVALAEKAGKSVALAAPTGRAAKRLEELCDAPAVDAAPAARRPAAAVRRRGALRRRVRPRRGLAAGRGRRRGRRGVHARRRTRRRAAVRLRGRHPPAASSATPRSCPRSGPAGCSATSSTPATRPGDRADARCTGRPRAARSRGWRLRCAAASCRRSTTRRARSSWCRPAARRRLRIGSCNWSPTRSRERWASPPTRCRWSRRCTAAPAGTQALNAVLKARLNPGSREPTVRPG